MQLFNKTVLVSLALALALHVDAAGSKDDTLRYEILLNKNILNDLDINASFISTIDVTASRLVLISSKDQFYLVGWGGLLPYGKQVQGDISSFALTHDSVLMTIRNSELCYFDSEGKLSLLYSLPGPGMSISRGDRVMYIYNSSGSTENYSIYVVAQGGMYTKLLEMPAPVRSVIEGNNSVMFASGSVLYEFNLKERELKAVTVFPADKEIRSVAVEKSSGRIFVSAGNSIYALLDNGAVLVSDDLCGVLYCHGGGLMVFNPEDKTIIRITGLEEYITGDARMHAPPEISQPVHILTNSTVVDLKRNNLSDPLIIALIRRAKVDFLLTSDDIIDLSGKGVSAEVIIEMRQAMKRQVSEIQNR